MSSSVRVDPRVGSLGVAGGFSSQIINASKCSDLDPSPQNKCVLGQDLIFIQTFILKSRKIYLGCPNLQWCRDIDNI